MKNVTLFISCILLAAIVSCKKKKDEPLPATVEKVTPTPLADQNLILKKEFLTTYANIAFQNYSDAKQAAESLKTAIQVFFTTPTKANYDACKAAYTLARQYYLQTEAYRGVRGPIDEPEGWLNSWPLDEGYIDFMFNGSDDKDTVKAGGKLQGIINNRDQVIEKTLVVALNGKDGEDKISIGYHAIEFLLWGQDVYADKPGQRPYTDYVFGAAATAPNADRRRDYLSVCADILVENLALVADAWALGKTDNYRADLLKENNTNPRLKTIISGMAKLTRDEFGGERILPGITGHDQEEEHSCFSDLTKDDFKYDALGFENILLGQYKPLSGISISGTGLKKLLEAYGNKKADTLAVAINQLISTTNSVYTSPTRYDQIILKASSDPEVVAVQKMSDAWVQLSDALSKTNQAFGFGLVDTAPEE